MKPSALGAAPLLGAPKKVVSVMSKVAAGAGSEDVDMEEGGRAADADPAGEHGVDAAGMPARGRDVALAIAAAAPDGATKPKSKPAKPRAPKAAKEPKEGKGDGEGKGKEKEKTLRAPSAFNYFCKAKRAAVVAANPGECHIMTWVEGEGGGAGSCVVVAMSSRPRQLTPHHTCPAGVGSGEVGKMLGVLWKEASSEDKAPFVAASTAERDRIAALSPEAAAAELVAGKKAKKPKLSKTGVAAAVSVKKVAIQALGARPAPEKVDDTGEAGGVTDSVPARAGAGRRRTAPSKPRARKGEHRHAGHAHQPGDVIVPLLWSPPDSLRSPVAIRIQRVVCVRGW